MEAYTPGEEARNGGSSLACYIFFFGYLLVLSLEIPHTYFFR